MTNFSFTFAESNGKKVPSGSYKAMLANIKQSQQSKRMARRGRQVIRSSLISNPVRTPKRWYGQFVEIPRQRQTINSARLSRGC